MELMMVDPRALKENPDQMRRSKSSPQADALLLASIKAVGIVQPPVILPARDGGNGYVVHFGHRRVAQAIAAELAEIRVLVADPDADHDAMRLVSVARALNPSTLALDRRSWRSADRRVDRAAPRCRCARSEAQAARQLLPAMRSDGEGRHAASHSSAFARRRRRAE
jgi:hypothetical protein